MSLYNALFGMNKDYAPLLGMIGVNMEYFERFRDIDITHEGKIIRVMTRLGGENREYYKDVWKAIKNHELYIEDYDDKFDNTYAYIEFKVVDKYKETCKRMYKGEPIPFKEKFEKEIKEMDIPGTEAYKRADTIAKMFIDAFNDKDGINIIKI